MNKPNYFKTLCLTAVLTLASFGARAQQSEISVYINGTLPTGQFNDKITPEYLGERIYMGRTTIGMGAKAGLGGTVRAGIWFDIGFGELLPFAEASFLWNRTNNDIRDAYDNAYVDGVRPEAPVYFNVPLTLGFKYRYDLTPILRPYAEVGVGYNILFISGNGYDTDETHFWYAYKPNGALSWMIGAGTYLGEFVSAGLYYQGLGDHRIDYTEKSSGRGDGSTFNYQERRKIGELGFRIGFHF